MYLFQMLGKRCGLYYKHYRSTGRYSLRRKGYLWKGLERNVPEQTAAGLATLLWVNLLDLLLATSRMIQG